MKKILPPEVIMNMNKFKKKFVILNKKIKK